MLKPKFEDLKQDLMMMYYVYNFLGDNGNTLETGINDMDSIKFKMRPLLSMMDENEDHPSFINSDFSFSNNDWVFYADLDDGILSLTFVALDDSDVSISINDMSYAIEININDKTIRESWSITADPMYHIDNTPWYWVAYEYLYSCDSEDNIVLNNVNFEHSDEIR